MGEYSTIVVNERFTSLQGEGLWTGMPMTFVRLQGCNLRCPFCDTPEAQSFSWGDHPTSYELASAIIAEAGPEVVCFTGGEPCLQMQPMVECADILRSSGYRVHLETNGSVEMRMRHVSHFDWITVSPKGPKWTFLSHYYKRADEVKFVMGPGAPTTEADADTYPGIAEVILPLMRSMPREVHFWLQPESNKPEALEWCMQVLEILGADARRPLKLGLSMQLHKLINIK